MIYDCTCPVVSLCVIVHNNFHFGICQHNLLILICKSAVARIVKNPLIEEMSCVKVLQ